MQEQPSFGAKIPKTKNAPSELLVQLSSLHCSCDGEDHSSDLLCQPPGKYLSELSRVFQAKFTG